MYPIFPLLVTIKPLQLHLSLSQSWRPQDIKQQRPQPADLPKNDRTPLDSSLRFAGL